MVTRKKRTTLTCTSGEFSINYLLLVYLNDNGERGPGPGGRESGAGPEDRGPGARGWRPEAEGRGGDRGRAWVGIGVEVSFLICFFFFFLFFLLFIQILISRNLHQLCIATIFSDIKKIKKNVVELIFSQRKEEAANFFSSSTPISAIEVELVEN